MLRKRLLVLCTAMTFLAVLAPTALAEPQGGKAADAARFVTRAELPPDPMPAATALQAQPTDSLVADAAVRQVPIYDSPDAPAPSKSLNNPTRERVLLIFAVLEERGDWLRVMLPMRPNGSTGWVRASDVRIRKVSNHLVVFRSERMLRAYHGDQLLFQAPVAVGKPDDPTPITKTYIDISIPFSNTSGAYGAHMLSLAAYSEVLTNFGGGVGQIAIHGTNNRGSVGNYASHGCIRMLNEDILKLKDIAPTGTPVEIVA